jgi:hypothetical protein
MIGLARESNRSPGTTTGVPGGQSRQVTALSRPPTAFRRSAVSASPAADGGGRLRLRQPGMRRVDSHCAVLRLLVANLIGIDETRTFAGE